MAPGPARERGGMWPSAIARERGSGTDLARGGASRLVLQLAVHGKVCAAGLAVEDVVVVVLLHPARGVGRRRRRGRGWRLAGRVLFPRQAGELHAAAHFWRLTRVTDEVEARVRGCQNQRLADEMGAAAEDDGWCRVDDRGAVERFLHSADRRADVPWWMAETRGRGRKIPNQDGRSVREARG